MGRTALIFALALLSGTAHAGSLAGARDGGYRSSDGDFLLVESKVDLVGVQGLDCHKPIVVAGRLKATGCWSNGHQGGDVDVSWHAEGDVIHSEGKRYVLLPPMPKLAKADPFQPSADGWTHNRSGVRVDAAGGLVTYAVPKPELRAVVKPGAVLYEPGPVWLNR